ncbi:hypothetical protein ACLI4Y_07670 [Natrialbaceae archaeon A-CW3]
MQLRRENTPEISGRTNDVSDGSVLLERSHPALATVERGRRATAGAPTSESRTTVIHA